jgi:flagellar M-ring protein FliF
VNYSSALAPSISSSDLIVAAALFLFISVLIFVSVSGRSKDDYRVLFSSVNERDGAAIVAALQQMNVPYKFTEGGAAILVPRVFGV